MDSLITAAARLIGRGEERLLLLEEVEALLASRALVVDACRHVVRDARTVVCSRLTVSTSDLRPETS